MCAVLAAAFVPCAGAIDCMVVRVVVNERTDGEGEEKVLPSTPSASELMPALAALLAPPLDCAVSELRVSGFVDRVGAAELLLGLGT